MKKLLAIILMIIIVPLLVYGLLCAVFSDNIDYSSNGAYYPAYAPTYVEEMPEELWTLESFE